MSSDCAADTGTRVSAAQLGLATAAGVLAILFIGATLPTPLYPLYGAMFGFGKTTLTLIYAVYVLGNLTALLFFGRVSDQVGRRIAAVPAITLGIFGTLLFLFANNVAWLLAARILSGLSTGLGAGAAAAWIAELQPGGDRAAAAALATAANFAGLAIAPLLAGVLASFTPAPLSLPYVVYLILLVGAGAAVWSAPETVSNRVQQVAKLQLRPRLGVPQQIRIAFIAPALTAFATFALIGFYAALIPSLLRESLEQSSPLIAGLVVFEMFAVAAAVAAMSSRLPERAAMLSGLALLPPSSAMLVAAQMLQSILLVFAAAALAGLASALGYRGSLEVVNRIAPSEQRSEMVSSYLVAVYLGNSVPVIGVGVLSESLSTTTTHILFACVITILAVGALAGSRIAARSLQREQVSAG